MTLVEPGWHEARAVAHGLAHALPLERVELGAALDRVLGAPISALTPLPPVAVSAMDGWAVCGDGPWRVIGEVLAGAIWQGPLAAGQAVRIATGAALPLGADGVLRSEDGLIDSAGRISGRLRAGGDIRPAGEEAHSGEELLPAGTKLTPARLGLAAASGHDSVLVRRAPRVRVLVLGDELLSHGPAREGRVRDSLGPQLPGWLERMGARLDSVARIEDTLGALVDALREAVDADIVVTTGGTAAGPVDHLHTAIARTQGSLVIDHVGCRPGHPMLLAGWPTGTHLVGLPGNPLAAVVGLLTLAQPLLAGLTGQPLPALPRVVLGDYVGSQGAKTRLIPCRLADGRAFALPFIGSGMLRGLAEADGFAVVGAGEGEPGSSAEWLPLP